MTLELANAGQFPNRIQVPSGTPYSSSTHFIQRSKLRPSLAMGSESRPSCLRCSKPARTCLCGRFKSPPLDNSIAVTILQHSLEKNHPLNSTKVARIGLKNVTVVPVTDVNFQAQFFIRPLEPNQNHPQIAGNVFEKSVSEESLDFATKPSVISTNSEALSTANSFSFTQLHPEKIGFSSEIQDSDKSFILSDNPYQIGDSQMDDKVTTNFSNYTITYSSKYIIVAIEKAAKPDIGWILNYPVGRAAISNGFMVRKLQRKDRSQGSEKFKDFEEFKLVVPPGSALLFPSTNAVDLAKLDYEIRQLIVLDGTWSKARRMYYENPWLKLLPQLKLDSRKESLYSEVRHQPKSGCLSTIESIVYALKGLGNDTEALDEMLEVFESMILDQRRCKDEKFRAMAKS